MVLTHPLIKFNSSELPNVDVISLFRQTTCSTSGTVLPYTTTSGMMKARTVTFARSASMGSLGAKMHRRIHRKIALQLYD